MVTFSLYSVYWQGLSALWTFVFLLAFAQPFFHFASFDSCEVSSHIFAAVQIVFRQLLVFFACSLLIFATFVAELEASAVQALNDFASVSPAVWR